MVNHVFLIGNTGKDPDVKAFQDGKKVAVLTLATSKNWKDKSGEKQTRTQWHRLIFWSPLAEIVEKYVKKGSKIFVSGEIEYREYEDKEGNKKTITEIICNEMKMLDGKPEGKSPEDKQGKFQGGRDVEADIRAGAYADNKNEDDLPF